MARDHDYWCYLLTNKGRNRLYIGVTNNLQRRLYEHRTGQFVGFTQQYQLNRLVWFEHFRDINAAIACEKRLKGWTRAKKAALIAEHNPDWLDLSADWPGSPGVE